MRVLSEGMGALLMPSSLSDLKNRSEICTVQTLLQPISFKSDRLLGILKECYTISSVSCRDDEVNRLRVVLSVLHGHHSVAGSFSHHAAYAEMYPDLLARQQLSPARDNSSHPEKWLL